MTRRRRRRLDAGAARTALAGAVLAIGSLSPTPGAGADPGGAADIVGDGGAGGRVAAAPPADAAGPGARNGHIAHPGAPLAQRGPRNATIRLHLLDDINPVVYISVNGAAPAPVQLDTGSTGLTILSSAVERRGLGSAVSSGSASYLGLQGRKYHYHTYVTTVGFCDDATGCGEIVTEPTTVNIVDPQSTDLVAKYFGHFDIVGVLGIGPNNGFPGTSTIISALPGSLGRGVLIDDENNQVVFGPNPLPPETSVAGSPFIDAQVSINGAEAVPVRLSVDSGGLHGTVPQSLAPDVRSGSRLPPGTEISVYSADGQSLLYSYTVTAEDAPIVSDRATAMNSGYFPFSEFPIYLDYRPSGDGRTVFDR